MAMDLRQVVAGVLTLSMFVMLGNMIKKEHVDPFLDDVTTMQNSLQVQTVKISKYHRVALSSFNNALWKDDQPPLSPCWNKLPHDDTQPSRGYVFLTLSHGPEYHAFQVGTAIVIARQLGAALVLPDIRSKKGKERRLFEELYDTRNFITSLKGIVKVVNAPIDEQSGQKIIAVRVPVMVSEETIATRIEPLFKKSRSIRVGFRLMSSIKEKEQDKLSPYTCLAMFQSLKLQGELQGVVESMVGTLRSWSPRSFGKFVAVDSRTMGFKNNSLNYNLTSANKGIDTRGIGQFMTKIGFERHTTVYLAHAGWHDESLLSLRQYFPTTFTKEAILPMDLKAKYLSSDDILYKQLIDFYVCTQSDIFVSGSNDQFQSSVAALRIASGKTQILSPAETSSTVAVDFVPTYVSKKTHMSYSCFC